MRGYVDTTILTDALLHFGVRKAQALNLLDAYDETLLPQYAIKEFKAGPFYNFVWMHNKLVQTTLSGALGSLQKMAMTPRRYTVATAIQALQAAQSSIGKKKASDLTRKHGDISVDYLIAKELRLQVRKTILLAWKKRHGICTQTVEHLPCYIELPPRENREMLEIKPVTCQGEPCCLPERLTGKKRLMLKLKESIKASARPEDRRRTKSLRHLARKARSDFTEHLCRSLGDAYFTLTAPPDAEIVTTNTRDHALLAGVAGIKIRSP